MECDNIHVKFKGHVVTPDTITLYRDEVNLCAVFRIVERKEHVRNNRQDHKDNPTSYQDRRDSLSLEKRSVQERLR